MKFHQELEIECDCGETAHSAKEFYATVAGYDLDFNNNDGDYVALDVHFYCVNCGCFTQDYRFQKSEWDEIMGYDDEEQDDSNDESNESTHERRKPQ